VREKNHQTSTFGFECVAKNIKMMIKVLYFAYLVCSQMWLNLPKDDGHFFYIFQVPMNDQSPLWLPTKFFKKKYCSLSNYKNHLVQKILRTGQLNSPILAQFIYSPPTQIKTPKI
jgi:hypothetical protein